MSESTILIVDDVTFMRDMLREVVEFEGYEVVGEAVDSNMAVEMYEQLRPDLVCMDLVMPGCSGIDALKSIIKKHADARVVTCSALGQENLVGEALKAGALGFIVKPYRPDSVLETIRKVLELERS